MKKMGYFGLILISASLTIAGCAPDISPNNYTQDAAQVASTALRGTVVAARPVEVKGNNNGVGGLAGAVAGGAAGSTIGGGTTANVIGAVGGAVIGGLVGNAVQKGVSRTGGIEYIIKVRKTGRLISVTQGPQPTFGVGQHVLVIMGNPARVIADNS